MRDVGELGIERETGSLTALLRPDVAGCHTLGEERLR
jgi:hypothetical protein